MSDIVQMTLESVKKHSIRYDNKDSSVLRSVYLLKTAEVLSDEIPETITIEVKKNG